MSEWDKAKEVLSRFIGHCNCNVTAKYTSAYEALAVGDRMQKELQFLQKSVELLGAVRADWFHQHNELIVLVDQLKKDNEDLAKLAQERTEKLEAIRKLAQLQPMVPYTLILEALK